MNALNNNVNTSTKDKGFAFMLEFTPLTLDSISVISPYFARSLTRMCDHTIGATLLWRDAFESEYCVFCDELIFRINFHGQLSFTLPIGGDGKGLNCLLDYCKTNNLKPVFCAVSDRGKAMLESRFEITNVTTNRDWFDYLYLAEELVSLEGKKNDGHRNHIKKFKKLYPDYRYEELTDDNAGKALALLERIPMRFENDFALEEKRKLKELLCNLSVYNLPGGVIMVGDELCAFSIGEKVGDTLFVHTEKADTNFQGAYRVMTNEFLKHNLTDDILYVNREEDDGIEGLRAAKMAYHPVRLIEKHLVELKI